MIPLLAALLALPDASAPLQPTSKWIANFGDDMCTIERGYGTPDKPIMLGIRADTPMNGGALFVLQKSGGASMPRATIVIDNGVPIKAEASSYYLRNQPLNMTHISVEQVDFERLAGASVLRISPAGGAARAFAVPAIAAALKLLDRCRANLLTTWGMPATEQARLKTPPKARTHLVFSSSDYPEAALVKGDEGKVGVLLHVDPAGAVAECRIISTSGKAPLDATTCKVLRQRSRFSPATDVAGKPMASLSVVEINWLIPNQ